MFRTLLLDYYKFKSWPTWVKPYLKTKQNNYATSTFLPQLPEFPSLKLLTSWVYDLTGFQSHDSSHHHCNYLYHCQIPFIVATIYSTTIVYLSTLGSTAWSCLQIYRATTAFITVASSTKVAITTKGTYSTSKIFFTTTPTPGLLVIQWITSCSKGVFSMF